MDLCGTGTRGSWIRYTCTGTQVAVPRSSWSMKKPCGTTPVIPKIERRCADIALELKRYRDAQRHLTNLVGRVASDSTGQAAAAELAELEDLLARNLNAD